LKTISPVIIFTTERLIVRRYDFATDAENFFLLNSDEEVMRYIRKTKTRQECDAFLKQVIAAYEERPGMGRWAAVEKSTGNFVGSFAFIPLEGTDDSQLGYALLTSYWGNGFATELMREGIKYVFSNTSINEVYGITEAANLASQKVLLKTGFVLDKKYKEGEKEIWRFKLLRPDNFY